MPFKLRIRKHLSLLIFKPIFIVFGYLYHSHERCRRVAATRDSHVTLGGAFIQLLGIHFPRPCFKHENQNLPLPNWDFLHPLSWLV